MKHAFDVTAISLKRTISALVCLIIILAYPIAANAQLSVLIQMGAPFEYAVGADGLWVYHDGELGHYSHDGHAISAVANSEIENMAVFGDDLYIHVYTSDGQSIYPDLYLYCQTGIITDYFEEKITLDKLIQLLQTRIDMMQME